MEDLDKYKAKAENRKKEVSSLKKENRSLQREIETLTVEKIEMKEKMDKLVATNKALSMQMNEFLTQVKANNSKANKKDFVRSEAVKNAITALGPRTKAIDMILKPIEQRLYRERSGIGYNHYAPQKPQP
ncbi:hypothetical protein DVA81_18205, partial [Acinetobacter baumannii]